MKLRCPAQVLVCALLLAPIWPAAASADHIKTAGTVSALVKARSKVNSWIVEITWTGGCQGASEPWYGGDLYLIDVDTGERQYVGAVVDTSGRHSVSQKREWLVWANSREQHLRVELKDFNCYEHFPLHGGPKITVTGNVVTIPRAFGGGGSGGGGSGGGGGDYGSGDPTASAGAGGCGPVVMGTEGPDRLLGSEAGDIIFGRAGNDRIDAKAGNDCLIGEQGNDRLDGGPGADRLTGGRGNDVLLGGPGINAYDAGPGNDYVKSRNGKRELVLCGSGRDRALADRRDRLRSCKRLRPFRR